MRGDSSTCGRARKWLWRGLEINPGQALEDCAEPAEGPRRVAGRPGGSDWRTVSGEPEGSPDCAGKPRRDRGRQTGRDAGVGPPVPGRPECRSRTAPPDRAGGPRRDSRAGAPGQRTPDRPGCRGRTAGAGPTGMSAPDRPMGYVGGPCRAGQRTVSGGPEYCVCARPGPTGDNVAGLRLAEEKDRPRLRLHPPPQGLANPGPSSRHSRTPYPRSRRQSRPRAGVTGTTRVQHVLGHDEHPGQLHLQGRAGGVEQSSHKLDEAMRMLADHSVLGLLRLRSRSRSWLGTTVTIPRRSRTSAS